MAEWPDVWMARCPDGQKSKWPQGELARRIVGQKARNLDDYMVYIEYIKQIPKYWCSLGNPRDPSNDPAAQVYIGTDRTLRKNLFVLCYYPGTILNKELQ